MNKTVKKVKTILKPFFSTVFQLICDEIRVYHEMFRPSFMAILNLGNVQNSIIIESSYGFYQQYALPGHPSNGQRWSSFEVEIISRIHALV